MAILHNINHDAGGAVTNFWDSETDPSAGIAVKGAAGLNGTPNGLAMDMTVNDTMRVDSAYTPPASNQVKFSCYLDPNGNSQIGFFEIFRTGIEDVGNNILLRINVENDDEAADITLAIAYGLDAGGVTGLNGALISDAPHLVEFELIRESSFGAADGEARWWLDTVLQDTHTNVQNFNLFLTADEVYAEVNSGSVAGDGVGDFYIDEILVTNNLPATDVGSYIIGTAIDNEATGNIAWVTVWRDDIMYLQRWDLPTLTKELEISLGAATLAQVKARSQVAYPFAGSDTTMWVFGNMASPAFVTGTVHLIGTTGGGTSGTWANSTSLTSWANTDVLDSLHVTPDLDGGGSRIFTAIRRQSGVAPSLWRGTNGLSEISFLPLPTGSAVEYRGMHIGRNEEISVGTATLNSGAGRIFSAISPYTSWTDKTFDYPSGTVEVLRYL